ncbi:MAG: MFS transporter [Bacteroidales bacterium]|nr:MFS transporter [Bacteroidales bacterium]
MRTAEKLSLDRKVFKDIFSSLYSRNYRLYFTGQGISLIGTWMQNIALSWLIYRLTGSVFLLGLIGFTNQIPTFVLAPFTGVLIDRFNRLKILMTTQVLYMLQALTITILVLTNTIAVWHIISLSLFFGLISAFDAPTRQALVIKLIDKPENLGNAIALNSAAFNSARLIGPAIAGITIAAAGEGICFLINTISYLAVLFALYKIRIPNLNTSQKNSKFKKSFTEGFRYTFQFIPIRTLIIMLAIISLIALSFIVLLPAYAKEVLNGNSKTLGYLMSALGAGALLGAIYMAARKTVLGLGKVISITSILLGTAIIFASFSNKIHFSLVIFFCGGLSMILLLSSINTLVQTIADEDKRGRVMSFYAMALMGTTPIGNLLSGTIASTIGIPHTLLICGFITIILGIWFESRRKSLRKYVHPIYQQKGILPGIPNIIS